MEGFRELILLLTSSTSPAQAIDVHNPLHVPSLAPTIHQGGKHVNSIYT